MRDHHGREQYRRRPGADPFWDERQARSGGDEWRPSSGWRRAPVHQDKRRRGRGYGSGYDAWGAGEGFRPAGHDDGPEEGPGPGGIDDRHWRAADSRADYRGRGPKGYRRSDERICEEACDRLTDERSVDASDVSVSVVDGEVTLKGFVASREQKRRAEGCVEEIAGVRDVINELRVKREDARREEGSSAMTVPRM